MNFSKYFGKEIKAKKVDKGITNDNYQTSNGYMIKVYSNLVDNNEVLVNNLVKDFDVDTFYFDEKVKITKIIKDGKTLEDENVNEDKVIMIAKKIKNLHNQQIECDVIFDPIKVLKKYKAKIKKPLYDYQKYDYLIDKAQRLLKKANKTLCHNDLTPGNLLFSSKKLFLIDWEYAGMNDPLFDVVSFLNENNLYFTKYKDIFIKNYFGNQNFPMDKIEIWNNYQNLMWCMWSNMMYDAKGNQIYLDICEDKIKNLKRGVLIKNYNKE